MVDIDTFMAVTGPKNDIWLVKTVAVVLIPISLFFLANIYKPGPLLHAIIVGFTSSVGLASIDFYYTSNDVILWVYAIDGVLQVLFAISWLYIAIRLKGVNEQF